MLRAPAKDQAKPLGKKLRECWDGECRWRVLCNGNGMSGYHKAALEIVLHWSLGILTPSSHILREFQTFQRLRDGTEIRIQTPERSTTRNTKVKC